MPRRIKIKRYTYRFHCSRRTSSASSSVPPPLLHAPPPPPSSSRQCAHDGTNLPPWNASEQKLPWEARGACFSVLFDAVWGWSSSAIVLVPPQALLVYPLRARMKKNEAREGKIGLTTASSSFPVAFPFPSSFLLCFFFLSLSLSQSQTLSFLFLILALEPRPKWWLWRSSWKISSCCVENWPHLSFPIFITFWLQWNSAMKGSVRATFLKILGQKWAEKNQRTPSSFFAKSSCAANFFLSWLAVCLEQERK